MRVSFEAAPPLEQPPQEVLVVQSFGVLVMLFAGQQKPLSPAPASKHLKLCGQPLCVLMVQVREHAWSPACEVQKPLAQSLPVRHFSP